MPTILREEHPGTEESHIRMKVEDLANLQVSMSEGMSDRAGAADSFGSVTGNQTDSHLAPQSPITGTPEGNNPLIVPPGPLPINSSDSANNPRSVVGAFTGGGMSPPQMDKMTPWSPPTTTSTTRPTTTTRTTTSTTTLTTTTKVKLDNSSA